MSSITRHQRNYGLDLARALAISTALFMHLYNSFVGIDVGEMWYTGYFAMDVFFALSGFLIGGMLIELFEKNDGILSPFQTWIFLLRRWFRTVPLYLMVLAANIVVAKYLLHTVYAIDWRYFFWMQNLHRIPPDFFGESWSLCVEEWFYFSFAAGLCIFSLITRKWRIKSFYRILIFCIIYIVAFNILRMCYCSYDSSEYDIVIFRLDATGYGVLAAIIYYYLNDFIKRKIVSITVWGIIISMSGVLIFLLRLKIGRWYIFYYPLIGIGLSLLMIFLKEWSGRSKHLPFARAINFTSRISYSYYLLNMVIIFIFLHYFSFHSVLQGVAKMAAAMLSIFLVSLCTYNFIELPFLRFRDKYVVWKKKK